MLANGCFTWFVMVEHRGLEPLESFLSPKTILCENGKLPDFVNYICV